MLKAIIIDDEENARMGLSALIKQHVPSITVEGAYPSLREAKEAIVTASPDVVFLDIQMPEETGLNLWKYFPTPTFHVVFTTAYHQYAIQAIKLAAFDYLMKPIDIDELVKVTERLQHQKQSKTIEERILALESNLKQTAAISQIVLPTQESLVIVKIAEIMRAESDDNYTYFFLTNNTRHLVSKTLKEYESMLPRTIFMRIHQSHLINLKFVKRYIKGKSGFVEMTDGKQVPVSREKREALIEALSNI
jgi:two-component system, LytTR family, response regulator